MTDAPPLAPRTVPLEQWLLEKTRNLGLEVSPVTRRGRRHRGSSTRGGPTFGDTLPLMAEKRVRERGVMTDTRSQRCHAASCDGGGRGPEPGVEVPLAAGEARKQGPPEPPERTAALPQRACIPERPCWASNLVNGERVNLGCLKPLCLW